MFAESELPLLRRVEIVIVSIVAVPLLFDASEMTDRDTQVCQGVVREHARTFHLASIFLSGNKRRAAFALYAFCRVADDIVDRAETARVSGDQADASVANALEAHRAMLNDALAGRPSGPIFRELHWVMQTFHVPAAVLTELLDGVAMDLRPTRYRTWDELAAYCEGVASSVGEMCTYVFGVQGDSAVRQVALRHARTLGMAMQLTNILRDVGEDARRGRCYLPSDELAEFGLHAEEILDGSLASTDSRWIAFMQFQIARAKGLYAEAAAGIPLLAPDAQRCARACAVGYGAILGAIEGIGFASLTTRARLGTLERAQVIWRVWRQRPETRVGRLTPVDAQNEWSAPAHSNSADELVRLA
jgi:15-cis-phytoene synthase